MKSSNPGTAAAPRCGPVGIAAGLLFAAALACGERPSHAAEAKPSAAPQFAAEQLEFFEKKIRPLLANRCYACHAADTKPSGGLRVDDRNGLLRGGASGPAVVLGSPDKSLLLQRVRHADAKRRMPLEADPLNDAELADLTHWIREGAAWPPLEVPEWIGKTNPRYEKLKREHWAWQPPTVPRVPAVRDAAWPIDDLDRFVLAKLESLELRPVGDADRATLIRRVTFDLTGLPPTPAEIDAFVGDASPDAYARVVDRLLGSPAFGERWARHWLDVARYAESTGPSRNVPYPHAWRYRDYVVAAVDSDVPYDRFLAEQIAGDLLPAESPADRDRLLVATGFLALGVKDVNQRFKERFVMDNVDEQIDATMRGVLALTVTCARCHDHEFDPIPTTDYYALAGIFTSTDNAAGVRNKMGGGGLDYYDPSMLLKLSGGTPAPPPQELAALKQQVDALKREADVARAAATGPKADAAAKQRSAEAKQTYERLRDELAKRTDPAQRGPVAHGVREAAVVGDTAVRLRGEAEKLGPVVPRGFLSVFEVPETSPPNPAQSGRLELAQWLGSPRNPLAARVFVNRVWHHLFGRGIVSTVDNFGTTGDRPSNPELLDHLAARFVKDGWSRKQLVRAIVSSRTYRLSSAGQDADARAMQVDPANRFCWKHDSRRLSAEEFRDAFLAAAGTLDPNRPEGSAADDLKMIEMTDDGAPARSIFEAADESVQRSLYLPLLRGLTPSALAPFDPVEQTLVTGARDDTTGPAQALFLLNSDFVRRHSQSLARRLLTDGSLRDDPGRLRTAHLRILGRAPTPPETDRALAFLAAYESDLRATRPAKPGPAPRTKPDESVSSSSLRVQAWTAYVQALFGTAEFRYLR